jgi:(p)ppGpp synthase/HD superfamily hydrolase
MSQLEFERQRQRQRWGEQQLLQQQSERLNRFGEGALLPEWRERQEGLDRRLEKERLEKERLEKERLEKERMEKERMERIDRLEQENELLERQENERIKRELQSHRCKSLILSSARLRQDDVCPICLSDIRTHVITSCCHHYCGDCIIRWLKSSSKCPVCREPVI